jgi:hypothetical protein
MSIHRLLGSVCIILILLTSQASAEFDPGLIGKGGKIGLSIANVANHPGDPESKTGYLLGAFFNYPLIKHVSFQVEILFSEKGYRIPDTPIVDTLGNRVGTAEWTAMVSYVEIPIMAKVTLPVEGKIKPYFNIGGFAAQAVVKKERRSSIAYTIDYDLENVKNTDAGFVLGAGVDIKAGNGKVFFEARYDYSNISMLKYTKYRSRVWSFQAGYWW